YHGGKALGKWPQEVPHRVTLVYGRPMPPTATAAEVRMAIQKLSADAALARNPERRPVHRQFVRVAARHPFRACFFDPAGQAKVLNYGKALAGAWCLADRLRPLLGDDAMVGIWLPPSVGAALTNIAV